MNYLLDTNILSELRKKQRCNPKVRSWLSSIPHQSAFISVVSLGELRKGIELKKRKDVRVAANLERWFYQLTSVYADRILPVDLEIAERWGILNVPNPISSIDCYLAATAIEKEMVLVTRNTKDVERTGVKLLNPFL